LTSLKPDIYLTPRQLEERAAERQEAARLLAPGKMRDKVLREAARDRAMAEIKRRLESPDLNEG
jgi:hypothetical protein